MYISILLYMPYDVHVWLASLSTQDAEHLLVFIIRRIDYVRHSLSLITYWFKCIPSM